MTDLIAFLTARLDERQAALKKQARGPFADMSEDELHQHRAHPAYEYATTEGQRKAWDGADDPPEGPREWQPSGASWRSTSGTSPNVAVR